MFSVSTSVLACLSSPFLLEESSNDQIHFIAGFFNSIMFSDEANFHVHGGVNRKDFIYWSDTNPNWFAEEPLHSPKVVVWAAIGYQGIIGPFFFDGNVNRHNYLDMLRDYFLPAARNLPGFGRMIFQQDGAPPHWALDVRAFLDQNFPNRWIGRSSPNMEWPPRSPDLTPPDFFLWGFIKGLVYRTPIRDLTELRERIVRAFQQIPTEMVQRAIVSYQERLNYCIEVNGRSVEQTYTDA